MGHQIIKQPNGNYALWSSIVDDFILLNGTPKDIVDLEVEDAKKKIQENVQRKVGQLDRGEKAYYQFTMTWEEALAWRDEQHGVKSREFTEKDFLPHQTGKR